MYNALLKPPVTPLPNPPSLHRLTRAHAGQTIPKGYLKSVPLCIYALYPVIKAFPPMQG